MNIFMTHMNIFTNIFRYEHIYEKGVLQVQSVLNDITVKKKRDLIQKCRIRVSQ